MIFTKYVYKLFIGSFPWLAHNPFTNNQFHASFKVQPQSTYINYKLDNFQYNKIRKFINSFENNLKISPISIDDKTKDKFLSINIYNCSSPLFSVFGEKNITRCEINTYVIDKKDKKKGTLIMDYDSNFLSMDPVNIFKLPGIPTFKKEENNIICKAESDNFKFNCIYSIKKNDKNYIVNNELHEFSDNIYYNNGILDKLYYDTSLTLAKLKIPNKIKELEFVFCDILFTEPYSVFYFKDEIRFSGSMWDNILLI